MKNFHFWCDYVAELKGVYCKILYDKLARVSSNVQSQSIKFKQAFKARFHGKPDFSFIIIEFQYILIIETSESI